MPCFFCQQEEGVSKCQNCNLFSCKAHLSIHTRGGECGVWRVENIPGAGRGIVANTNVKAGEIVIRDYPVVEGPLPGAGDICCVCLDNEGSVKCGECGLTICKSRTRGCPKRHQSECNILKKGKENDLPREALFTAIAVIRLLWAAERDPSIRAMLEPLMDHRELHANDNDSAWRNLLAFLSTQGFNEDSVTRALGLLQTNGVTSNSDKGLARGHGLYPVFSIVNNSCIPNTRHTKIDDAFCLITTVDIQAGEEVTTAYKSPTLGNIVRQSAFKSLWNFSCTCKRCSDPTEMGTFSSSLLCGSCQGPVVPVSSGQDGQLRSSHVPVSSGQDNNGAEWACQKCAKQVADDVVDSETTKLASLVERAGHSVDKLENLTKILETRVHPHHFLLMQVKRMLLLLYGNSPGYRMGELKPPQIQRKIELCRDYIEVFSILEPGLTKWRGRVCEELARALVRLEGQPGLEVCRLIGEAGKCRQLDSQEEKAAFNQRVAMIMSGSV